MGKRQKLRAPQNPDPASGNCPRSPNSKRRLFRPGGIREALLKRETCFGASGWKDDGDGPVVADDPNVRYEALLAVQKLMVHNWEYLGRQIEKPGQEKPPVGLVSA